MDALIDMLSGEGIDLSRGDVDLLVGVLGVVLAVVGMAILTLYLVDHLSDELIDDASTRLVPTLAEDALDADLQQVYQQTRWLDAGLADRVPQFCAPTGSRLGRGARRFLLSLQAARFAASRAPRESRRGEPPSDKEARLEEVERAVAAAIDALESLDSDPKQVGQLARLLERLADRVENIEPGAQK